MNHRAWAVRDCDACRRYLFDAEGHVRLGPDGEPVENACPPACERTPCGSRPDKPRLTPDQGAWLELYGRVKRFGCLPAAGGLADQDPAVMAILDAIGQEVEAWNASEIERARAEAGRR